MIERTMKDLLIRAASRYPVILLMGPRGAGKTWLVQSTLAYDYVSMEDPDIRDLARSDPWNFLYRHYDPTGSLIIDEIQYFPELLRYVKQVVESRPFPGSFILTSSRFCSKDVLGEEACRFTLLSPSIAEVGTCQQGECGTLEDLLFGGCYCSVVVGDVCPNEYYASLVHNFVEKELGRQLRVFDPDVFFHFFRVCAGRIGQVMNFSSLGDEVGVSHNTAKAWLEVLERNYFTFYLQPYPRGFGMRPVKTAKLYFYDTGLACWLLGIRSAEQLTTHYLRGGLFESLVIGDLMKQNHNWGRGRQCYFWRNKAGNEIDCLIDTGSRLFPIEIKAGRTILSDYIKGLSFWSDLTKQGAGEGCVVYAGDSHQQLENNKVVGWRSLETQIAKTLSSEEESVGAVGIASRQQG